MFIAQQVDSWSNILDRMRIWHILHNQLAPDNPFVSPQWSEIWYNTHGNQKRRNVFLLAATDKEAEGIILLSKGRTHGFKLPVRSIESIGAGNSNTDRHFVSVQEPLLTQNAIDPLLESIKTFKDWAFFRLAPLPADYPYLEEFLKAARRHGLPAFSRPYSIGYKIRTSMGWDAYEQSRSKNFRKKLRASYNKIRKNLVFRIEAHTDALSAATLLSILNEVSMKSWKIDAHTDIFN